MVYGYNSEMECPTSTLSSRDTSFSTILKVYLLLRVLILSFKRAAPMGEEFIWIFTKLA